MRQNRALQVNFLQLFGLKEGNKLIYRTSVLVKAVDVNLALPAQ